MNDVVHFSENLEEEMVLDWYDGPIFRRGFYKDKEYYFIFTDLGWDNRGYWHEEAYWVVGTEDYYRVRIHYSDYHYLIFDVPYVPEKHYREAWKKMCENDAGYCFESDTKYRPVGSREWLER